MEDGYYDKLILECVQLKRKIREVKTLIVDKDSLNRRQLLAEQQLKHMNNYLDVLKERIEDLDEEEQLRYSERD